MFMPLLLSVLVATVPLQEPLAKGTATPQSLPKASVEALHLVLDDERRAEALYASILQKHGEVRPFSMIIQSERCHQSALEALFETHGLPLPPNPWKDKKVEAPSSFKAACEAGIAFEVENVALYDRLMKTVTEPDLVEVFERLRWASQERHLQAFRRQVARLS